MERNYSLGLEIRQMRSKSAIRSLTLTHPGPDPPAARLPAPEAQLMAGRDVGQA